MGSFSLSEGNFASSLEAVWGPRNNFACSVWMKWVRLKSCMAELMRQQTITPCCEPAEVLP